MAPSPSCSRGWAGPLWQRRSCGPSRARTEVEDAGVKEISLEISSSLVPCTILLTPAVAHWRGCTTMPYTRTFAARLSVVYPMTPLLASPGRNPDLPSRSGHAHSAEQGRTRASPIPNLIIPHLIIPPFWAHRGAPAGWVRGKEVEVQLSAGRCVVRGGRFAARRGAGRGQGRNQNRDAGSNEVLDIT